MGGINYVDYKVSYCSGQIESSHSIIAIMVITGQDKDYVFCSGHLVQRGLEECEQIMSCNWRIIT